MSVTLTIHHNIFLTREERLSLHSGESIETIGYAIPVWTEGEATTEPAKEVFCRYYLLNSKEDEVIKILDDGFEITIPHKIAKPVKNISNEVWRNMNAQEKQIYYNLTGNSVTSLNLLDVADGGAGSIMYRENSKFEQEEGEMYSIVHFVTISAIENLLGSIDSFMDNPLEQTPDAL